MYRLSENFSHLFTGVYFDLCLQHYSMCGWLLWSL